MNIIQDKVSLPKPHNGHWRDQIGEGCQWFYKQCTDSEKL